MTMTRTVVVVILSLAPALPSGRDGVPPPAGGQAGLTPFLKEANDSLLRLSNEANQAGWVQETYITSDTEAISARASQAYVRTATAYAKKASMLDASGASADEQRHMIVLNK